MNYLASEIKKCQLCASVLPYAPNPVVSFSSKSKIAIIGQAPGRIVHKTGIPWSDKSGDRLRNWLGVSIEDFYDTQQFALVPMGFCYPGTGKSGDFPPRKECGPTWHPLIFKHLKKIEFTILIGSYAQKYYLKKEAKKTLTETVQYFEEYLPNYFVLPHLSPRNNIWLKKNPWFEQGLLPQLKKKVFEVVDGINPPNKL